MKIRILGLITSLVLLSGCQALLPYVSQILGGAANDGISVDAQVGDRENEAQVGGARGAGNIKAEDDASVTVNTVKNDSNIDKAENVTIQSIPPWVFFLTILGWVLPTPQGIFKYFLKRKKCSGEQ